jgi:hypothetical protein
MKRQAKNNQQAQPCSHSANKTVCRTICARPQGSHNADQVETR